MIMRTEALAGTVIAALNWHAAADDVRAICEGSGAGTVIIHRDLITPLAEAREGGQVIGVTPAQALCDAYGILPAQASAGPDIPEWSGPPPA